MDTYSNSFMSHCTWLCVRKSTLDTFRVRVYWNSYVYSNKLLDRYIVVEYIRNIIYITFDIEVM